MALSKVNLELKYYCTDFSQMQKVLRGLGAQKVGKKKQKDYFFPLSLEKEKRGARLKLRIENSTQMLIYYERPNFQKKKAVASLVEIYHVNDSNLLGFLGKIFETGVIVEKTREVWRKNNTVFHLDTIKGVGKIFEVEFQKRGRITSKDQAIMKKYREKLLPYLGGIIKGSNRDLVGLKAK